MRGGGDEYSKNLAEIQVTAIISMQDMQRNLLLRLIGICIRRHVGSNTDGHQHGGRKPTETYLTEFCSRSVNIPLGKLKNIKILRFR